MKEKYFGSDKKLLYLKKFQNPALIFLGVLWLLVNLGMLWHFGIRTGADSEVYIKMANALLEGELPDGRLLWYSSYIGLLAIVFGLGGSLPWVAGIQIVLSGIAALMLWRGVGRMTGSFLISFLAVFLYLAWIKIHQWNIFIYTESVFTSLAIISFCGWILSRKPWHYLLVCLLILTTFFMRPTGFSFLMGWLIYGLAALPVGRKLKGVVLLVPLLVGILLLNYMLKDFVLVESYAKGEIIYPNISLGTEIPDDLRIPSTDHTPLERLLLFIWYQPLYFFKISLIKFFLFFANVKPYFSLLHNILIVLFLYPLYAFAIRGYITLPSLVNIKHFLAGFILSQALTVTLTTNDWDGRFLVPILPFIFVLSAVGIHSQTTKKPLPYPEEVSKNS